MNTAVNYNEDDVEISDSDVDVQTVAEEIKVVEEKIKPKPPEKFELMEYPCTICGSSDFFATVCIFSLTLYHTIMTFKDPEKIVFWKHCGKRRRCW